MYLHDMSRGAQSVVREPIASVDILVWTTSLVLVGLGVAGGNPASLLLGQIGWAALLLGPETEVWRRMAGAAVLLIFTYVAAGEALWIVARLGGIAGGWQGTGAFPSVLSGILATASATPFLRLWKQRSSSGEKTDSLLRRHLGPAAAFLAVMVLTFPALRGGTQLGTAGFAISGSEHMHNLLRAAEVDRVGFIPYGYLSPIRDFTNDYYPRGFHLVSAWLNAGVDVTRETEPQPWILGYLQLFWLLWAMTVLSLTSAASHAFNRLGHRNGWVAGVLGASVIFVPAFYDGVVMVGFSSYLLALLAVSVSLTTFLFQRWSYGTVLVSLAAFVVASHGWLVMAVVPLSLAACQLWSLRPPKSRTERASSPGRWAAAVAGSAAVSLLAARPWGFTLLSGDATNQAKENGHIEGAPTVWAVITGLGLALLLFWPLGRSLARIVSIPVTALALIAFVGIRAAGWDLDLYYPRKIVWATLLLLLPLALASWVHLGDRLVGRVTAHGHTRLYRGGAGIATVLLAGLLVLPSVSDLMFNRPRVPADSVRLAERAVEVGGEYQLIIVDVDGAEADRASSMWGRAARDMRRLPSVDVSEINFETATAEGMCYSAAAVGVPARVVTRVAGVPTEQACPA